MSAPVDHRAPDTDRGIDASFQAMAPPAWTFATLYLHLRDKINHVEASIRDKIDSNDLRYEQRQVNGEKAVDAALKAAKEAVTKAETASEKRFDSVNEFRAALSDQAGTLMSKAEAEPRLAALAEKIASISARIEREEGKEVGTSLGWTIVVGGIAAVSAVINSMFLLKMLFGR